MLACKHSSNNIMPESLQPPEYLLVLIAVEEDAHGQAYRRLQGSLFRDQIGGDLSREMLKDREARLMITLPQMVGKAYRFRSNCRICLQRGSLKKPWYVEIAGNFRGDPSSITCRTTGIDSSFPLPLSHFFDHCHSPRRRHQLLENAFDLLESIRAERGKNTDHHLSDVLVWRSTQPQYYFKVRLLCFLNERVPHCTPKIRVLCCSSNHIQEVGILVCLSFAHLE